MNANSRLAAAVISIGCLLPASALFAGTGEDAKASAHTGKVYTVRDETARILKNAEEQSYDLHDHAVTMQAATQISELDRAFFVAQAQAVKQEINTIGKEIARLEALSTYESPAEQRTVRRVKPQLTQIAQTAERTIAFLNNQPQKLEFSAFSRLTTELRDQTNIMWKTLHDSVTLAGVRERERHIRDDMARLDAERQ